LDAEEFRGLADSNWLCATGGVATLRDEALVLLLQLPHIFERSPILARPA